MTAYHRLLLLTTLGSALLTFCLLQMTAVNSSGFQQSVPQQKQSMPQPKATEYYASHHPHMMTLVWQPQYAYQKQPAPEHREIGI